MKSATLKILLLSIFVLNMTSCGFDKITPEYPTKKVLFTYQTYNRQIVVGEGLMIKVGVVFAGLPASDRDRVVKYVIEPSLITDSRQSQLPPEYYRFDDAERIIIPEGQLKGYLPMRIIDSAAFVNDPKALTGEYILPIRITEADADQISEGKGYTMISLSYQGRQYGNYTYHGVRTNDSDTSEEYDNSPTNTNSIRQLQTVSANRFRLYADQAGSNDPNKGKVSMILTVPVSGSGNVTIEPDPDYLAETVVTPDGESTYDAATKTFVLKYKYEIDGVTWHAEDTMTFRNRVRDDQGDGRVLYEWRGF